MKISVSIITFNEEHNLIDCLESVRGCDEIVVVDSFSTDRTVEIARRYTDRVIQRAWPGYVAQKNFALEQCTGDWILCLDADERCTPELRDEIRGALVVSDSTVGYTMSRHTRYLGRWINHGGWYPDRKLRLVRRGRARWEGVDPHDKLVADGPTADLQGEIHHFTYRSFAHQLRIVNKFSDVAVDEWIKEGRLPSLFLMLFHPPIKFLECYVWKLGFLDGLAGFIIAVTSSFYAFAKHVKLWEKGHSPL